MTAGNWPWWLTERDVLPVGNFATLRERNLLPSFDLHVDLLERRRVLLILGSHFEDDVVLVVALVEGRDLALAKGIVERVVDRLRVETPSRAAASRSTTTFVCRPRGLLVAVHILELRDLARSRSRASAPSRSARRGCRDAARTGTAPCCRGRRRGCPGAACRKSVMPGIAGGLAAQPRDDFIRPRPCARRSASG